MKQKGTLLCAVIIGCFIVMGVLSPLHAAESEVARLIDLLKSKTS
jgi:hypothetical protein